MVRSAALLAIAFATSACSLVVGDEERVVAASDGGAESGASGDGTSSGESTSTETSGDDAGATSGDDASAEDASGASNDAAAPADSGGSCLVPPACIDGAKACDGQCLAANVQCEKGCTDGGGMAGDTKKKKPCTCAQQLDTCKAACVKKCVDCTTMDGCPSQPACVAAVP